MFGRALAHAQSEVAIPTISSSSGTLTVAAGCPNAGASGSISVTLSGSIPSGYKLQYRYGFGTSAGSGLGSWTDSGSSSASQTINTGSVGPDWNTSSGLFVGTGYFSYELRIIDTGLTSTEDSDSGNDSQSGLSVCI